METKHSKNLAAGLHLSIFAGFIFPLGNFIAPLILWLLNRDESKFIDHHGKQVLNFQLSWFVYKIILGIVLFLLFWFNILNLSDFTFNANSQILLLILGIGVILLIGLVFFLAEIAFIIIAGLKAQQGVFYKYPLTIPFIM